VTRFEFDAKCLMGVRVFAAECETSANGATGIDRLALSAKLGIKEDAPTKRGG